VNGAVSGDQRRSIGIISLTTVQIMMMTISATNAGNKNILGVGSGKDWECELLEIAKHEQRIDAISVTVMAGNLIQTNHLSITRLSIIHVR